MSTIVGVRGDDAPRRVRPHRREHLRVRGGDPMILTAAQAIAADRQIESPLAGIIATGRVLLANHARPQMMADWLASEIRRYPAITLLVATGQECPWCYAIHDETAYRPLDMTGQPTGDDGWCSDDCQDRAAERWFARYQEVAA